MYNFGYKFRAGVSLDGVYDAGANIYAKDYITPLNGGNEEEALASHHYVSNFLWVSQHAENG